MPWDAQKHAAKGHGRRIGAGPRDGCRRNLDISSWTTRTTVRRHLFGCGNTESIPRPYQARSEPVPTGCYCRRRLSRSCATRESDGRTVTDVHAAASEGLRGRCRRRFQAPNIAAI